MALTTFARDTPVSEVLPALAKDGCFIVRDFLTPEQLSRLNAEIQLRNLHSRVSYFNASGLKSLPFQGESLGAGRSYRGSISYPDALSRNVFSYLLL